jgi:TonB family protein
VGGALLSSMRLVRLWAMTLIGLFLFAHAFGEETEPERVPDNVPPLADLGKNGKRPKLIKPVDPDYPSLMSRAGLIGTVNIRFVIDRSGNVRNPYVTESNNPWFERPAIDAIMKWKFQPGEFNGQPVFVMAEQKIEFRLFPGGTVPELWHVSKGKDHNKLPEKLRWEVAPMPLSTTFPVYPYEQLRQGTKGKAKVTYVIGPAGNVVASRLEDSSVPEFGAALLAMIDGWKFSPPKKKDGTPCYATFGLEYNFMPSGRGDVPVSDGAREILSDLERKPERIDSAHDLDAPLKPLSRRPPNYPTALWQAGQPGKAVIEFFIDKNGDAQLPTIISSTAPEFGYAAVQAVATWRFEPPRKGRKPTIVRVRIPLSFNLDPEKNGPRQLD